MEPIVSQLVPLLPAFEEVAACTSSDPEAAFILRLACDHLKSGQLEPNIEAEFLVSSLVDKSWERIHTGHFSEVPEDIRKVYAIAAFFKIVYMLGESTAREQVERCSRILDEAFLLGCTDQLYDRCGALRQRLMQLFGEMLDDTLPLEHLPVLQPLARLQVPCDIPQYDCPSLEVFAKECFAAQRPALLLNTLEHWPARHKWHDLNYIQQVAGNRTVPIEIGSNYATAEWSQQLVKITDFLRRQFTATAQEAPAASDDIEYLAQHELFKHIPQLKEDIRVPDYCMVNEDSAKDLEVNIMAWLGPRGTVSPMHYDPKHNLLAQVFGAKSIILASPVDSERLYPHPTKMLGNTTQLDAAHVDLERFPLAAAVQFLRLTLQEGDCLYIPPKWWHYVESLAPSFSVSFWWGNATDATS